MVEREDAKRDWAVPIWTLNHNGAGPQKCRVVGGNLGGGMNGSDDRGTQDLVQDWRLGPGEVFTSLQTSSSNSVSDSDGVSAVSVSYRRETPEKPDGCRRRSQLECPDTGVGVGGAAGWRRGKSQTDHPIKVETVRARVWKQSGRCTS